MANVKSLHDLHSWTGILLGLLIYTVCFTGIAALFIQEIIHWEMPEYQNTAHTQTQEIDAIDTAVAAIKHRLGSEGKDYRGRDFFIALPNRHTPYTTVSVSDEDGYYHYHSQAGIRRSEFYYPRIAHALRQIHTDLMLPPPYGRYLVGFTGILMLISAVSGILIHRRLFSEIFAFRPGKSLRLTVTDLHKSLSVWLLPFHITIAFTGAVLGLGGLLIILAAGAAYKGDQEAAIEAVMGTHAPSSGEYSSGVSLTDIFDQARQRWQQDPANRGGEWQPKFVEIHMLDDLNSTTIISFATPGHLNAANGYEYHSISGDFIANIDNLFRAAGLRFYSAITPLHYGNFGGTGAKVLYALMGIITSALMISGILIWQDRQRKRNRQQTLGYRLLSHLALGVPAALLVATLAVFPITLLAGQRASESMASNAYLLICALVLFASGLFKTLRTKLQVLLGSTAAIGFLTLTASLFLRQDYWAGGALQIYATDGFFMLLTVLCTALVIGLSKRPSVTPDPRI